jgi:molybdopterin-guanine dinucleotide biosynthesis protein A
MNDFGAVILAGGRSSRMGMPKAALPFGATTVVERILDQLRPSFDEIVLSLAPEPNELFPVERAIANRADLIVVRDAEPWAGPVPALARAFGAANSEILFACSCDLPLLDARVAVALCAMVGTHDAAIPEIGGHLQPLHAAYRRESAAAALAAMAAAGEARLRTIAERIDARRVGEAELRALDPELRSFIDIDTAADYARALRLAFGHA